MVNSHPPATVHAQAFHMLPLHNRVAASHTPQALHKISDTWAGLQLSFAPYQDSDVQQMSVDDAVMEALESDNLALQNMSSGKYVQVRQTVAGVEGRPACAAALC